MKIIAGVENYDSGNVSKIKNLKLGYLTQQMTLNLVMQQFLKKCQNHLNILNEWKA